MQQGLLKAIWLKSLSQQMQKASLNARISITSQSPKGPMLAYDISSQYNFLKSIESDGLVGLSPSRIGMQN